MKDERENIEMQRVIPLQWSLMDTASLEINIASTVKFRNMSKIFNHDWKMTTPHFEIKTSQKGLEEKLTQLDLLKPPKSFFGYDYAQDIMYITWLIAITFMIIYILRTISNIKSRRLKDALDLVKARNKSDKETQKSIENPSRISTNPNP